MAGPGRKRNGSFGAAMARSRRSPFLIGRLLAVELEVGRAPSGKSRLSRRTPKSGYSPRPIVAQSYYVSSDFDPLRSLAMAQGINVGLHR
jgi:hypothetical protein